MPPPKRTGLALACALLLPGGGLADCAARACADSETSSLLQTRGEGSMEPAAGEDLSEVLTEGTNIKKSAIIVIDMQNDFVHPNGTLSGAGEHVGVVKPINKLLSLDWGLRIFTGDNHPYDHVSFARVHTGETTPNGPFPIRTLNYSILAGSTTAKICGSQFIQLYGESGQICNGYPTPSGEVFSPDTTVPQELYPAHCIQSTWGQKIYEELNFSYSDLRDNLIYKGQNMHIDSYSAIFNNIACNGTLEIDPRNHQAVPLTCIPKQKLYPYETDIPHLLRASGVERVFFVGLCLDYCVKFSAIHTAFLGKDPWNMWKTYVVRDATQPCNPSKYHVSTSIQQMKDAGVVFVKTSDFAKRRR